MRSHPKVLFISPSAYVLSGLATWLDYLQPGLAGYEWSCVTGLVEGPVFHRPKNYLKVHPLPEAVSIPCSTGTPFGRCQAMAKTIHEVQPDIVVSINIPDVYKAIQYLRYKGDETPVSVMTIHGIQADLFADLQFYRDSIDAVIATNRLACWLVCEHVGLEESRVLYAPYGVRIPEIANLKLDDNKFRIVYTGRLEKSQKRIHELPLILEALDRAEVPYVMDLAGDGPEEVSLRKALHPHIDSGRVRFLGLVSPEQLETDIYPRANALLVMSSWETGPIVIWEAMSHRVPVVSSRYVGSGREKALEHERNALLFDIGDTEGAARNIVRLWQDAELASKLIANGLALVKQRYSVEASLRQWDAALRATLRLPKRVPKSRCAFSKRGKLDHLLGVRLGECARRALRRSAKVSDPGGEWSHAHNNADNNSSAFWIKASQSDKHQG